MDGKIMKALMFCSVFFAAILALNGAEKAASPAPVPEVQAVETGKLVPELSGVWTKGDPVKIAEQKGKNFTVLYFWAVNQQSLEDMPRMGAVVKRFEGKPVIFAGVGCDEVKKVTEFFRAKELPMPVLADDKYVTLRRFLRPSDRVPLAVIVDKAGRLVWRGNSAALPGALDKLLDGKFDLEEHIRREKFSAQVSAALSRSHYEEALKLIDDELVRHPGNVELVSVKANILLRGLKRTDDALKAVDAGIEAKPKELAFYELKLKLLYHAGRYGELPAFYDRLCKEFADRPMVMVRFAEAEMNRPIRDSRPELFHKVMTAAYACRKFKDDRERGLVTLAYARMLYFCGCPEAALTAAKRSMLLLKGKPEYEEAEALTNFFSRIAALAKRIGK